MNGFEGSDNAAPCVPCMNSMRLEHSPAASAQRNTEMWSRVFNYQHKICLLYETWKLLTLLWRCLSVCFKIMHCKLEFTELMKCLQGGYDDPLKERALPDNLSNSEKKMLPIFFFFSFFPNAANVSFFGIWGWEDADASFLFQSLSLLPGAVLLWAGGFFIPAWGYFLL